MELEGSSGWRSGLSWLIRIGADPTDTREEALSKETLVLSTTVTTVLAVVWVFSYWAMGLYLAAAIPLAYQVTSIVNLALFAKTGRYRFFRWCALGLSLILPLALQLSLGGFIPSSGVVLWSFTAPLGALLFSGRREAVRWFAALVVIALAGTLDPVLTNKTIPGCGSQEGGLIEPNSSPCPLLASPRSGPSRNSHQSLPTKVKPPFDLRRLAA